MRADQLKVAQLLTRQTIKRLSRGFVGVMVLLVASAGFAQNDGELDRVMFSKLVGDDVQINLVAQGSISEPSSFNTDNPARIVLDFFGLKSNLAESLLNVQAGKVNSVVTVETADRTRVIVNLYESARYEVLESDDGYAITVFNSQNTSGDIKPAKLFAKRPDIQSSTQITNVDFRRSEAGGGSLIVDLSDDNVVVDTREQDGEIVIDLIDVSLPRELERRLDVVDFATPVQTIDAFQNANQVRLVIVPQGKYQHLSYQSGNRFTLTVDPIVQTSRGAKLAESAEQGFIGERLSINFQKIDVRSALAVIADFTGINFVTSDSVSGEITINLKDVPWDQALDVILRTKGLAQRKRDNVIWIAPAREIQQIEEEELKANKLEEELAPLVSELVTINYAKAEDVAEVISSVGSEQNAAADADTSVGSNTLLTSRGSVTADARTNSVLIQDVAKKIQEIRLLIKSLDKPVRQVLIETRIVQANDNFSRELGARLGFQRITEGTRFPGLDNSNIGTSIVGGTLEGNTTINDSFIDEEEDDILFDATGPGLAVDLGANGIGLDRAASYAVNLFRSGGVFAGLISLELSALEADGRGKIVASPRLVTANQREAVIRQGEERIFQSVVTGTAGAGASSTSTEEAILELEVTPQITPDDRVIMDVRVLQEVFLPTPDGATAALSTQEVVTQVLADNGETIIIGGIYQEDIAEGVVKVPILGDIPILGNLFKRRSTRENRTELLIFLTPKIISPRLNLG